jgi:hypothetical protein
MKRLITLVPIVLVLLIGISTANAHRNNDPSVPQAGYSIDWYTIDGGGAMNSNGGSYSLSGSIGQPDAGSQSGGTYTLNGGFWGGASINYNIYLPLTLKNFYIVGRGNCPCSIAERDNLALETMTGRSIHIDRPVFYLHIDDQFNFNQFDLSINNL